MCPTFKFLNQRTDFDNIGMGNNPTIYCLLYEMCDNKNRHRIWGGGGWQGNGEDYITRCFVLLTKYLSGDEIKKNEMGGACDMYGGHEKCIQGFGGETRGKEPLGRPRPRWEDNIKVGLQEVGWGGMDCITVAQDRGRWRALVNVAVNLRVP
jgi:hypothetical protein